MSIGIRQFVEYKEMEEALEVAKDKQKNKQEQLRTDMEKFERKKGARPPGAKENEPGRFNHSTNCGTGQPAAYGYVHDASKVNQNSDELASPEALAKKRSNSTTPSSGRSSSVNTVAMNDLDGFNNAFSRLVDRLPGRAEPVVDHEIEEGIVLTEQETKKLKSLRSMRKRTLDSINSYKAFADTNDIANKEYTKRIKKLAKIDGKIEKLIGDDVISSDGSSRTTLGS